MRESGCWRDAGRAVQEAERKHSHTDLCILQRLLGMAGRPGDVLREGVGGQTGQQVDEEARQSEGPRTASREGLAQARHPWEGCRHLRA